MKTIVASSKLSIFNTNQQKSLPKSSNQCLPTKTPIRSKAMVIFNAIHHHQTTKPSPEKNNAEELITAKLRLISGGIVQCHNSVLRNAKNMVPDLSNESRSIQVKKLNIKTNNLNTHGITPISTSTSINQIPIKVSRYKTTTTTVKHSRKHSIEKKNSNNQPKLLMSQSSSATKISGFLKQNTKDIRALLTKFSLISHLTISKVKKNDSFSNPKHKNPIYHPNNSKQSNMYLNTNNVLVHNNTLCNIKTKGCNRPNNVINTITNHDDNLNNLNQKDILGFISDNVKRSKKQHVHHRNLKIQSAFKSLKSVGNSVYSSLPVNQKVQISTEAYHNAKIINVSNYVEQIKNIEHKTSTESVLQKYTYQSKLYTNNNKQQTNISNHSPFKSTTTNGTNNNQNCSTSSLQLSTNSEANYFKAESKKLTEYITQYYSSNNQQYPETSIQFYKIGRAIGHGAFGKVNIGLHILTGKIVAIKSFNKEKNMYSKSKIERETKLMKKLRPHKNIVKVFEKFEGEKYDCIIMENISGGNLFSLINKRTKLPEQSAKFIFKQLIEGLKYVHSKGIVHRDIKPDNILIDLNNTIKICDFGVGKEIKHGQLLTDTCGTPAFVAPEILSDHPYDPFMTDIWSSGVVLYSMLSGLFPFKGNNDFELHKCIMSGQYSDIIDISDNCKELIAGILEVNPENRMTIDEILSHPWMTPHPDDKELFVGSLFTNAERIIYSKLHMDYRSDKRDDLIELFTYKNIDTSQENENQNVESKSFINTPFNSRINNDGDDEIYFQELNIENEIMKFLPKVNELNRNYEINYNAEADQGFIIQQKKRKLKRQLSTIQNSIEIELIKKTESRKKDTKRNNKTKTLKDTDLTNNNTKLYCVDDLIIKNIEDLGYKRDHILKSLEHNKLNHATATYYLLNNN